MVDGAGKDPGKESSASRRRFIKAAGLAGLAASVGTLIGTRSASALYQHTPNASTIAPNAAAIQPAVIGGRNCWQMAVWKTR